MIERSDLAIGPEPDSNRSLQKTLACGRVLRAREASNRQPTITSESGRDFNILELGGHLCRLQESPKIEPIDLKKWGGRTVCILALELVRPLEGWGTG